MKKITAIVLSVLLALSLAACGKSDQTTGADTPAETTKADTPAETTKADTPAETTKADTPAGTTEADALAGDVSPETGAADTSAENTMRSAGDILIVYFSVMETDGVDTVAGASRVAVDGEPLGNCQYVAELIQQATGGDLFAIETVQEYPRTHQPLLDFAHEEQMEGTKPELATHIEDIDAYDTIFLGYPIWNADLPMPLYTFLEGYDLNGKTIIPFTVHGGSGFARTISTIADMYPEADVLTDGLSISRNDVSGAADRVAQWVQGLDLTGGQD